MSRREGEGFAVKTEILMLTEWLDCTPLAAPPPPFRTSQKEKEKEKIKTEAKRTSQSTKKRTIGIPLLFLIWLNTVGLEAIFINLYFFRKPELSWLLSSGSLLCC